MSFTLNANTMCTKAKTPNLKIKKKKNCDVNLASTLQHGKKERKCSKNHVARNIQQGWKRERQCLLRECWMDFPAIVINTWFPSWGETLTRISSARTQWMEVGGNVFANLFISVPFHLYFCSISPLILSLESPAFTDLIPFNARFLFT